MKVRRSAVTWFPPFALIALVSGAASLSILTAPRAQAAMSVASFSSPDRLPAGVLPRSTILARYATKRSGISVRAKLVSLAALNAVDPNLAQCDVEARHSGQLVWLVLQDGPPGSFLHSYPLGVSPPPGAMAWSMFPVNAVSGASRNVSEIGNVGNLSTSAWRLKDLDPVH
jgi:hypothetical protein